MEISKEIEAKYIYSFMRDVIEIAKHAMWRDEMGPDKAQELIDEIQAGKYWSQSGVWVQIEDVMSMLKRRLYVDVS